MRPLAFDLCCGLGGWTEGLIAAGWEVWGFDTEEVFRPTYPGSKFYCCDVRLITAYLDDLRRRPSLIVASPPCQEFSRHQMPWTRRRNPPEPDLSIWKACEQVADEMVCPIVIENVRAAQRWMGPAKWHYGPFYLWGSVPALMPLAGKLKKKESLSSSAVAERAKIPFALAEHIGRVYYPHGDSCAQRDQRAKKTFGDIRVLVNNGNVG